MVIEPFHTWPKTIKPAPEPKPGPTQEQLNRWTASYAAADAGSLGAPPAAAERTADAARTQGTRPANSVSPSTVTDTQTRLTTLGYDTGGVDGIAGQKTDQAIRDFQAANGLTVDGIVGPQTRAALADANTVTENQYFGIPNSDNTPEPSIENQYFGIPNSDNTPNNENYYFGIPNSDNTDRPVSVFNPNQNRDLPERVEVVRADVGASVGPIAIGNETIYTIEYFPNGEALVTKHTEAGAGLTGSWRIGGFVNAGEVGEGGIYLGAGAQYLGEGVDGETYRVPADLAQDIVRRDALHFARDVGTIGISFSPGGLTGNDPSPLEAEGTLIRRFEGFERDGQLDGLAEFGIHDADWLGPFENFIGGSLGGEYATEVSTTTHQDLETGNSVVRAETLDSGELDISFLELQDAKAEDDPTVFGINENPQGQRGQYVEIVSNDQGEVIEVVYGKSQSNGETLARTQWTLDATDPDLAERIQSAMSDRGGATGYEGLAELAEEEGQQRTQSYDISGTNYGGGGDFFPLPDVGAGGSVNLAIENYDGTETSTG